MPDNQQTESREETTEQTEEIKEEDKAVTTESTKEEMATEEEIEETQIQTGGGLSNLGSPEGFIMMGVAITLDATGLVINLCGLDDCGILDIVGIVIICGWMLFKGQGKLHVTASKGGQQQMQSFIQKLFRGKTSKFLTPIIGEIIPYVGALPCWTLAVFFEVTEIEPPAAIKVGGGGKAAAPTPA